MKCSGLCGTRAMAATVITLLVAGSALATSLATDPDAMTGWKGTQRFKASDARLGTTLDVGVEYAVYEESETDYVYAYQVFNDLGNVPVSTFSVGLDSEAEPDNIEWDDSFGTPDGIEPTDYDFVGDPPTSAVWYFLYDWIYPPDEEEVEYSVVLIFESPNGPQWASATVMDGGLGDTHDLPSPIPEPATLALMGLGGLGLLLVRKRQ